MTMCIPDETDWTCAFTAEQIEEMRLDSEKSAAMKRSEALAWYTLAALCAWQIGVCPTTVRPCSARCAPAGSWMAAPVNSGQTGALPLRTIGQSFTPHVSGGEWVNSCGCSSADACSCGPVDEVLLLGPVGDIVEVKIGGVVIDPTWYRVDNGNRLVAQHEGLQWPLCQDMSSAPVAPPTIEPVTLVLESGTTLVFSREDDVVTLVATPTPSLTNSPPLPIPAGFAPAAEGVSTFLGGPNRAWGIMVDPGGWEGSPGVRDIVAREDSWLPITAQWLAEPLAPAAGANTFEVTYYRGAAPNEMTKYAAGLLAAEFLKACAGDKGCRLSPKVKGVVRNGVSYELDWNLFENGWTRIEAVDAVIRIYNPHHLKGPSRVLSPDGPARQRRTTWATIR